MAGSDFQPFGVLDDRSIKGQAAIFSVSKGRPLRVDWTTVRDAQMERLRRLTSFSASRMAASITVGRFRNVSFWSCTTSTLARSFGVKSAP
jgi:hypothetical protein